MPDCYHRALVNPLGHHIRVAAGQLAQSAERLAALRRGGISSICLQLGHDAFEDGIVLIDTDPRHVASLQVEAARQHRSVQAASRRRIHVLRWVHEHYVDAVRGDRIVQEVAKELGGGNIIIIVLAVADDRRVVVVAEGGKVQVLRRVLVDFEVHAGPHRVHLQLVPADELELALAQQQDLLRPLVDPVAPLPWCERAQGLLILALGSRRHICRLKYGRGHL